MQSLRLSSEMLDKLSDVMRKLAETYSPTELALAGEAMFAKKGGCDCGGGCSGSCTGNCGGCGGSTCKGGLKLF